MLVNVEIGKCENVKMKGYVTKIRYSSIAYKL